MNTKERIVDEALTLFSVQGFKGTTVKNIAVAVGIKDSSLYKHCKSNQEILDAIVDQMKGRMEELSGTLGIPQDIDEDSVMTAYKDLSLQELQEISRKAFLFYLKDEFMSRFWRLSQMEQYQNREIYNIYRSIFFEQSIKYQSELFAEMIRQGAFREADLEVVAVNFYAPIYFLLSKYQEESDVEEALRMLDKQIEEFYHIYKKQ